MSQKHENYDLLNLLGYGLAKFDKSFIKEFDFSTKQGFFNFFVEKDIVATASVVKNRMDLFDYFFPENPRKGWWQKGDAYIHRKILIDSLFGELDVKEFANMVKMLLKDDYKINFEICKDALLETKFKKMQTTGLEAECYFMNNYNKIKCLNGGTCLDARLFGDGYDFFIKTLKTDFLCEVKGIKENYGTIRLTQKEFDKALEYTTDYLLIVVISLSQSPKFLAYPDPVNNLKFKEKIIQSSTTREFHLDGILKA